MLHLYVKEIIQGDSFVVSDKEQLHHMTVVLRARRGDAVILFDSAGMEYRGDLIDFKKDSATVRIESRHLAQPIKFRLTVACAIPKGAAMDDIVDKLTQLGVHSIIPIVTVRVVAKPDDFSKKLERWRKIALSAAEQSGRNSVPEIPAILSLEEVLKQTQTAQLKLIPTLEGQTRPIKEVIMPEPGSDVAALIGPEGDFTPAEVEQAFKAGYLPVSLGRNVLRVDTAAVAAAAFIKLSLPD